MNKGASFIFAENFISTYPHVCISFAINCICMKANLLETKYNSHSPTIKSLLPNTIISSSTVQRKQIHVKIQVQPMESLKLKKMVLK